jgi:hypothetical protein
MARVPRVSRGSEVRESRVLGHAEMEWIQTGSCLGRRHRNTARSRKAPSRHDRNLWRGDQRASTDASGKRSVWFFLHRK